MKVTLKKTNFTLSESVMAANSLYTRVMGLMFKKNINKNESLLIEPCNSIHTCFMNFPIDVLFVSKKNEVVHVIENMKPWRFSSIYFRSKKVVEFPGGTLKGMVNLGDILEFQDV